ncbi:MAG: glycosyltransferase family 10 [Opitutaceae bacterium]|jgi:hypothetical protein
MDRPTLDALSPGRIGAEGSGPIRIKLLGKFRPGMDGGGWFDKFPAGQGTTWGNCHFTFDRHCRDYDWLVVYDDLPSLAGERYTLWEEPLACPRTQTLLITTEPSTVKVYGTGFIRQFGWVLSSQEPWIVRHPRQIYRQPALIWFYANTHPRGTYDAISRHVPSDKTRTISTVCSSKQQRHTLHGRRYDFIADLKRRIPEMDIFGHGVRFIVDKADALDPYRYHVAVENFHGLHHWTEKLADPFLGACMPVYYGCPNAEEYFPPESFLRIDIADPAAAAEIIRRAIRDEAYEKNLPAILESRRRVVENYGPIATISRLVNERHQPGLAATPGESILSRHRWRRRSLFNGLSFAFEKLSVAARHRLSRRS